MFEHRAVDRGGFIEIRAARPERRKWRWWEVFEDRHTRRLDRDDDLDDGEDEYPR
ncbi:hypothetical protein [Streptomyces katrae]|uniref:hypothetical protein n=1 Tax=Streptomyces katrae TaxID=68223 RepID=UPI000AF25928|nr:hypothetical protein [Streptomyces katrae]